jgi:hypothetical protein
MIVARLGVVLILIASIRSTAWSQSTTTEPVEPLLQVRFDAIHSHTWVESVPVPGVNQYHLLASPSRAAQALVAMGCNVEIQLNPWDAESLQKVDVLVLNLVSADRPAFKVSEIEAIGEFVQRGGGLILITDHTNCYFHNHVLEALFERLDLRLTSETACELPPRTLAQGGGWILVDAFGEHPITKGVESLGVQTGGTVDDRFGIAWTSPQSWADAARIPMYGEGKDMGFSGNFQRDPDERTGPVAVVAAKQFGAGRIVVIGDQNAIGGFFLNYADNRRMWLQSVLWAAGDVEDSSTRIAKGLRAETGRTLVWCVEPLGDYDCYWGSTDREEYYNAFAFLNKHADARASHREPDEADWMLLPSERLMKQSKWQNESKRFVSRPNRHCIVFLVDTPEMPREWLSGLLDDAPHSIFETDASRVYRFENGSTLELWKQAKRWSNRELLGPEATRNDADDRWEEALMGPLWKLGLKRVRSFAESIDWPEE